MNDDLFQMRDLDDLIHEAMRDPDRTVELTLADGYGYQIVIDDVPFPNSDDGIPRETLASRSIGYTSPPTKTSLR